VLIAAKLIGEIAGIQRFTSDAQLARLGACAPIPVSSGRTDRYRLDPGGNRQLNHAVHMLALTKISHDPQTALYMAKQRARGQDHQRGDPQPQAPPHPPRLQPPQAPDPDAQHADLRIRHPPRNPGGRSQPHGGLGRPARAVVRRPSRRAGLDPCRLRSAPSA
jgi:hypothetical protein